MPGSSAVSAKPGNYDFGLSPDEEARARRLHQASMVVDMLFQYPGGAAIYDELPSEALVRALSGKSTLWQWYLATQHLPFELAIRGESQLVRDWWRLSGISGASMGVSVTGRDDEARDEIGLDWIEKLPWLRMVSNVAGFRKAKVDGVLAVYGNCQPTYGLPPQLDAIDRAYGRGLRVLMLTYNRMDFVGTGCTERVNAGLSNYGLQVIERCNSRGIVIDTSHCGKQTTLDACRFSKAPVLANHTSASAVYAHVRGKSDEELDAIAATGGIVGVVAVPFFLASGRPTIEAMLDHIDYIARRIGWQHVGIGTDWPLQAPHDLLQATVGPLLTEIGFRPQDHVDVTQTLIGFEDSRDFPNITRGLVKRGYPDGQIRAILGENFLRVFAQVCG
jgi:membrane dipeptidase